VFNRPDTTTQVFEAIRKARPPRLYVVADGPRPDRAGEAEKVARVREIATAVDWPCEVKTLFREENLGCKKAVSGAITWFFEQEEQGIILEDDCLPSQSFFWFCEVLLEKYKHHEQIFLISGYNKQNKWCLNESDYFISFLGGIWGWATWKRAWQYYDAEMSDLEAICKNKGLIKQMGRKLGSIRQHQLIVAKKSLDASLIDTWDYSWGFSRHKHNGLACVPSKSLVKNIGFGANATHTREENQEMAVSCHELVFPLCHPVNMTPDVDYDIKFISSRRNVFKRIVYKVKSYFSR